MGDSTWKNITPARLSFQAADPKHIVTCLQFDSDKIVTCNDNRNVDIYDIKTGALRTRLQGHEGGVWALRYFGNTLVSASTDRTVRVWDHAKAECTHILHGHTSTVRCLEVLELPESSDSSPLRATQQPVIISGSRDSTMRIWRLPQPGDEPYLPSKEAQGKEECPYVLRTLAGHTHTVRAMTAYGDTIVSGSYDRTVRVWKISTGDEVHKFDDHQAKVYSIALDRKRNRCISGSMDHMVKIWCLEKGILLYNLEGHTSLVGLISLKEDQLLTASADSTLRIWDPETGQCRGTLTEAAHVITTFDHDHDKIVSGSQGALKLWNAKTACFEKYLLTDLSGVWQVGFDAQRCIVAAQRGGDTYIEVLDFSVSSDPVPGGNPAKVTQ
ncbi:hypothetical protein N7468_005869 [Penicillium chermesinum]|uniref:Uncharacterized protein n=1 Tax=Penicillium chermesinum TaxID=63820 RepID=A0A9W9TNT2_9EURO|nr:uncharacterized protein N7468_005869 [Penicillium chermesinum]KAJ5232913.1 hypothetical protein N7468_005869 [Penicillium chermesinum]KAJ6172564.1 hypothetical protein N7470_001631 [Penicillium chermesinum]